MKLKEALIDVGLDGDQIKSFSCTEAPLIVKRFNQHPCDPPLGDVVAVHYDTLEKRYELLIS